MRVMPGAGPTIAAAVVIALLGACAGSPTLPDGPDCAHATSDGLQVVFEQVSAGELAEAYPKLTTIIGCPQFGQLESTLRHSALVVAGFVAGGREPDPDPLRDVTRAEVRRHDDDRVLEVDGAPL